MSNRPGGTRRRRGLVGILVLDGASMDRLEKEEQASNRADSSVVKHDRRPHCAGARGDSREGRTVGEDRGGEFLDELTGKVRRRTVRKKGKGRADIFHVPLDVVYRGAVAPRLNHEHKGRRETFTKSSQRQKKAKPYTGLERFRTRKRKEFVQFVIF